MENKKFGWQEKPTFESYYYKQLQKLKSLIYVEHYGWSVSEKSSLGAISEKFDEVIELLTLDKQKDDILIKYKPFPLKKMPPNLPLMDKNIQSVLKDDSNKTKSLYRGNVLVVDINFLTSDKKDMISNDELKKSLEIEYKCKVLLIDNSRSNTQGCPANNLPAYFI
jgi:hypothetical protein